MTVNSFKYGGSTISVLNQTGSLVPTSAHEIMLPADDKSALGLSIVEDLPTLLVGESGTGKTSVIKYLAFKRKQGYVRINMHGYATPDELIGSKSVKDGSTYYENGILTNAMLNGHIVVLDEINATPPDCTFIIHGLLDDDKQVSLPNGDVIRPHQDFRFFATMNPDYEGTKSLNRAFLDRFSIVMNIDTLNPDKEALLLMQRTGLDAETTVKMVTTGWLARKAYADQKTISLITTRSLLQWGKLIKQGLNPKTAYVHSIAYKARSEEQEAFKDFYCAVFKTSSSTEAALDTPTLTTKRVINNYESSIQAYKTNIDSLQRDVRNLRASEAESKDLKELYVKMAENKRKVEENLTKVQEKLEKTTKLLDGFKNAKEESKKDASVGEKKPTETIPF